MDAEEAPVLPTLMRNAFTAMKTLNRLQGVHSSGPCNDSPVRRAAKKWMRLKSEAHASAKNQVSKYGVVAHVEGRIVNVNEND